MKSYSLYDAFVLPKGKVSKIYADEGTIDPIAGEVILIDNAQVQVKEVSKRTSGCICGGCGSKHWIYVIS